MGAGSYDSAASAARVATRAATNTNAFTRTVDIRAGRTVASCHETLDLTKKSHRECRDNDDNPEAVPIMVGLDVTGSMSNIPQLVIQELHKMISAVQDEGIVKHPAILFAGIGDANSDRVPMQVGEFESSDELAEQHLTNIYLEGAGGGQNKESYELFLKFASDQVQTDHWDKRGEKGFLFLIGDEDYYPSARSSQIQSVLGYTAEDEGMWSICDRLQKKWNVFLLRPGGTSNYSSPSIQNSWREVLPAERVVQVEDWHDLVPMMAGLISVMSGNSVTATIDTLSKSGMKSSDATSQTLAKISNTLANADTTMDDSNSPAVARL